MSKFKGPKPAGQPRSLRSITEEKTRGDFPAEVNVENPGEYKDPVPPESFRGKTGSSDPKPFRK